MKWKDFYEQFYEMSYVNKIHNIKELTDFESNDELTEVIIDISFDDKNLATALLNKAIEQGVRFNGMDFVYIRENVNENDYMNAIKACETHFTEDDLWDLEDIISEKQIKSIYKRNNIPMPEHLSPPKRQKEPGLFAAIVTGMFLGDLFYKWLNKD